MLQGLDKEQQKQIDTLEQIKNRNDWTNLIISGPTGTGKTYLCTHIFSDYIVKINEKETVIENELAKEKRIKKEKTINPYFISDNEFKVQNNSNNLKLKGPEEYNEDDSKYPLEMLRKSDLVIFDDYGSSNETESYFTLMTNWLDYRINKGEKTIWTTNLSSQELQERDARIASRMQMNSIVVTLSGPDRRKTNQEVIKL